MPSVNVPIFCLQEHFLLRENIYKLSKHFGKFSVLGKPAHKNFQIQDKGRPMGGLATIVPKFLRKHTTILGSKSWRIQPLNIRINGKMFLIINSYFPTDHRTIGGDNAELDDVLAEINYLISSTQFHSLYLVGDLNFEMIRNSSHVGEIKEFLMNNNLYSLWRDFPIDFTHTSQRENGDCFVHTLDHIVTLNRSS